MNGYRLDLVVKFLEVHIKMPKLKCEYVSFVFYLKILKKCHENYIIIVTKKESIAMANGIYIEIKKRILDAEEGSIFVTSDFTDIATTTTVRKCLGRQVEEKKHPQNY